MPARRPVTKLAHYNVPAITSMVLGIFLLVLQTISTAQPAPEVRTPADNVSFPLIYQGEEGVSLLSGDLRQLLPDAVIAKDRMLTLPDTYNSNPTPPPIPPKWIPPRPTAYSGGPVPVYHLIVTDQPVVFLTIDDGVVKEPRALDYMREHDLRASLFLNDDAIKQDYDFFKRFTAIGSVVENHTVSHPNLTKLNAEQQHGEICTNADRMADVYGRRPQLFRPPYGSYNDTTLHAAADCGMKALVHWQATINNGVIQYQSGDRLQPGDIVLIHFRQEIMTDLKAFYEAVQSQHLEVGLLEDWLR